MYKDSPQILKNSACLEDVVCYYKSHTLFCMCIYFTKTYIELISVVLIFTCNMHQYRLCNIK